MNSAQLLARGTIYILGYTAVGKVNLLGIIVQVISDIGYTTTLISYQRAIAIKLIARAVGLLVFHSPAGVIIRSRFRNTRRLVASI